MSKKSKINGIIGHVIAWSSYLICLYLLISKLDTSTRIVRTAIVLLGINFAYSLYIFTGMIASKKPEEDSSANDKSE